MSFKLKEWANFPPEERISDKVLLKIWRESEQWQYSDYDLITFLKTWHWLYSQQDECRWMDDANFSWMKEEREEVIKKYIHAISFLWKDTESDDVELHIERTFDDIEWIDIQAEIQVWSNQELTKLSKATKETVFDLVDAKNLLKNSEVLEFDTAEEIFFFVLNLLWFNSIAAYLNGSNPKLHYTLEPDQFNALVYFIEEVNQNNTWDEVRNYMYSRWIPKNSCVWRKFNHFTFLINIWLQENDFQKIQLKENNPN